MTKPLMEPYSLNDRHNIFKYIILHTFDKIHPFSHFIYFILNDLAILPLDTTLLT